MLQAITFLPGGERRVIVDGVDYALDTAPLSDAERAEAEGADAPPPPPVPSVVTMRQARLALLGAGLLPLVDAAIAALPSPQREAALIEWDYSSEVHRDRAFVLTLAAALGLSAEQLDALFVVAASL